MVDYFEQGTLLTPIIIILIGFFIGMRIYKNHKKNLEEEKKE